MLKQQSRHAVSNALYQSKLPLSNNVHGANKMCPPETLHVLDAGITIYMMESLRLLLPGGKFRSELDDAHIMMSYTIKGQSERDLPRGSIRNGIIDTTRCQSSERRGNLFLLVCIAHTLSGAQLLKQGLGYNNARWKKWLKLLKYYLAMTEWFHDCRPKEEVQNARVAVAEVMKGIQVLFPRSQDSHGYNIPKMHALSKVRTPRVLYCTRLFLSPNMSFACPRVSVECNVWMWHKELYNPCIPFRGRTLNADLREININGRQPLMGGIDSPIV